MNILFKQSRGAIRAMREIARYAGFKIVCTIIVQYLLYLQQKYNNYGYFTYSLFRDYLKNGYYPFASEDGYEMRLRQVINQTMEVDIPQYANMITKFPSCFGSFC